MANRETLSLVFKEVLQQFGLDSLYLDLNESPYNDNYNLDLRYKIDKRLVFEDLNNGSVTKLIKIFDPLMTAIENSSYVKSKTSYLENRVNDLEKSLEEKKKEVEELKQYKTYYDLHYKMENGK